MRCKWILSLVVLFGLAVVGCNESMCTRSTDCQGTLICSNLGTCVVPPDLAGTKTDVGDGGSDGGVDLSTTSDLSTTGDDAATTD
jgi:hypothetical protein